MTPPLMLDKKLADIFMYHAPKEGQAEKYQAIRHAAYQFAVVICENTPRCADQTAAVRHIREAVMTANASIALDGLV